MNKYNYATYYENFVQKDERRCEYELWKFYELIFNNNEFVATDSQHATGECFALMPSVLKMLDPEITEDKLDKIIPEALKLLYKLLLPVNRQGSPMKNEMMIKGNTVPKHYKSKFEALTEDEAKGIWAKIKVLHPECKKIEKIEEIPLNELHANESWQQQLIRRVFEYNRFKKRVCNAEATTSWSVDEDEGQATPEQMKQAHEKHSNKLIKFWTDVDPRGVLQIERAKELKKEWAKEAENNKAKKAKLEDTKNVGDEEEQ